MGAPPPPKHINTRGNGDIHREQLFRWIEDGHWFSILEASNALNVKPYIIRRYVDELKDRGYLLERKRIQHKQSRSPQEFSFKDNWHLVTESNHPLVTKHVKRLRHLAEIYMSGQFPREDSLDAALTEISHEIHDLEEVTKLLRMITENPDMRSINYFVKRMR